MKQEVIDIVTKCQTDQGKYFILDLDEKYFAHSSKTDNETKAEVVNTLVEIYRGEAESSD